VNLEHETYKETVSFYANINQLISGTYNNGYSPSVISTNYGSISSIDDFAESYTFAAYKSAGLCYPTD